MKKALVVTLLMGTSLVMAETKVGIIGLDTSHVIAFTQLINVEKPAFAEGFRVAAAYQWGSKDIFSATNRYPKYLAEVKSMGVEVKPTLEEMLAAVDCVCLETNDGREHLWQAEKCFAAGKPVFIDKPIAHNLADAYKIYTLGKKYQAKYFSASSLRFTPVTLAARAGEYGPIRGVSLLAPAPYEPTHGYYSWYAIHGFEPMVAIMGLGVDKVTCLRDDKNDCIAAVWQDGRMGELRLQRDKWTHSGYILPEKAKDKNTPIIVYDGYNGYQDLLKEILKFFETGKPPFPAEETMEIMAFMEAAEMSAKRGGAAVTLAEAYEAAGINRGEMKGQTK